MVHDLRTLEPFLDYQGSNVEAQLAHRLAMRSMYMSLVVSAGLLMAFGAGFLLIPKLVLGMYGVVLDASAERLARMFGTAVLALGLLGFLARNLGASTRRLAGKSLLCFFLLKSAVTLEAVLGGMFNALGWTILAIDIPMSALWAWVILYVEIPMGDGEVG